MSEDKKLTHNSKKDFLKNPVEHIAEKPRLS